jgi:hypothetical protein
MFITASSVKLALVALVEVDSAIISADESLLYF